VRCGHGTTRRRRWEGSAFRGCSAPSRLPMTTFDIQVDFEEAKAALKEIKRS
jgi:hypothetical protein